MWSDSASIIGRKSKHEHHFGKAQKNKFEVVQIGGTQTQTIVCACKKISARKEPLKIATKLQVDLRLLPNNAATKAGACGN